MSFTRLNSTIASEQASIAAKLATNAAQGRRPVPSAVPRGGVIVNRCDLFGDADDTATATHSSTGSQVDPTLLNAYTKQFRPLLWETEPVLQNSDEDTSIQDESMDMDTSLAAFPLFSGELSVIDLSERTNEPDIQRHNQREAAMFDADALADRFAAVAVTADQIVRDAQLPWARHSCTHKVIHIPYDRRTTITTAADKLKIQRKLRPANYIAMIAYKAQLAHTKFLQRHQSTPSMYQRHSRGGNYQDRSRYGGQRSYNQSNNSHRMSSYPSSRGRGRGGELRGRGGRGGYRGYRGGGSAQVNH
ncbi:hypothetical protein BDF19DRAFT_432494 [Syncephalis fuscata]|nr:hypothetical protein BDF19DRAFT_432494 [Syncephalis fuscata]